MRCTNVGPVSAVLLFFASAVPSHALDWKAFEDPKGVFLTNGFARSISVLPAPEKAAAVKRLQASLQSGEVEIRRRAALTLGRLGDRSGVPAMIADLSRATGRDRDNVVVALRVLKDDRAVPALRKALKDPSPYVRGIAVAALGELKAAQAYDDIVALTRDRPGKRGAKEGGVLACLQDSPADMACYALGALGDKRAVPVLVELLDDNRVQTSAVRALEVLTRQKLGNDPEQWKSWWRRQDKRNP